MRFCLCFAAVLVMGGSMACGAGDAGGGAVDLYLLAGQSNMDGRGQAKDLDERLRGPMEGAMVFYRNPPAASGGWRPLTPGFSVPPGYKGKLPSPTFGPEIGFARAMLAGRPGRQVAIIKASKGGTSLAVDWNPGRRGGPQNQGPCYRNFIETVSMGRRELEKSGRAARLRGMLWHQGESDVAGGREAYEKQLTEFIARVREDLGEPELSFIIGEVFDDGKRDGIRAAQRAVAKAAPRAGFASSEGLRTWDKGTHFDAASQLVLGERFAEAMMRVDERGTTSND